MILCDSSECRENPSGTHAAREEHVLEFCRLAKVNLRKQREVYEKRQVINVNEGAEPAYQYTRNQS